MSDSLDTKKLSRELLAAWGNALGHIEHKDADLRFYVKADVSTYSSAIEVDHSGRFAGSFLVKVADGDINAALAIAVFEAFSSSLTWTDDVLYNLNDYDDDQIACARAIYNSYMTYRHQIIALKDNLDDALSVEPY